MSWAEIKKVNSNLGLPLNEMISKESQKCIYGLKTILGSSAVSASTSWKTIANVIGKGYLLNALFCGELGKGSSCSKTMTFKITIDDEVVLHLYFNPTNTSTAYTLEVVTGIMNLKSGMLSDGFSPFFDYDTLGSSVISSKLSSINLFDPSGTPSRKFISFSPNMQTFTTKFISSGLSYYNVLVPMNELLKFEKNFKVEVLGDGVNVIGTGEYLVTYTLGL